MNQRPKIAGIGEVLWDMLPNGKMLGGAPANFCYHAGRLGAEAALISAIGQDENGREIIELLRNKGLQLFLNQPEYPTGTVSVNLKDGIPEYEIHRGVAWDHIRPSAEAFEWLKSADALCFGSLAQRSEVSALAIHQALEMLPAEAIKVFDVNLRQNFFDKQLLHQSLAKANVVKLNDEEIDVLGRLLDLQGTAEEQGRQLMHNFGLRLVALTMGSKGSWLFTADDQSFMPVPKVEVVDTIGAGDSFTAVLVTGLLLQKELRQIHEEATTYAARVCMHKGAMPAV